MFLGEIQDTIRQETIIFLNASFFNQEQWKTEIQILKTLIPKKIQVKIVTYDYRGVGESSFFSKSYQIQEFLNELKAVIEFNGEQRVHIFGKSLGAWIGLNAYISCPNLIKTFAGYGNIAPFHDSYSGISLSSFDTIEKSINTLIECNDKIVTEKNWYVLFEAIYLPIFFPKMFERFQKQNKKPPTIKKIANILFPLVKGNSLQSYLKFFTYFSNTIFDEGKLLLRNLQNQSSNIPVLFINGKQDQIADPKQTISLHEKISHSKMFLIESLAHGSLILSKGTKKILKYYVDFLGFC